MYHAALMRMLDRVGDGGEQLQAHAHIDLLIGEKRTHLPAIDELHGEIRPPSPESCMPASKICAIPGCCSCAQHIFASCSNLRNKARDQTRPNDLGRDHASGIVLFSKIHRAHAAFADPPDDLIASDAFSDVRIGKSRARAE